MIIYQITNLINNKKYIGRDAFNNPNYFGGGKAIKAAIKKHGKENFKKEILEYCDSKEKLLEREEYWLKFYNVENDPNFYNMTLSSEGWQKGKPRPERQGKKHSKETRDKISQNGKGKTGKASGVPIPIIQYRYEIVKIPIAEYSSSIDASNKTGIPAGDIRAAANGRQNTAGGFMWGNKETHY
jgi:group I intron endonuclease